MFCKRALVEMQEMLARAEGAVVIAPASSPTPDGVIGSHTVIEVDAPRQFFLRAVNHLIGPADFPTPGISAQAHIDPSATIASTAHVGPGVWIGPEAKVGDGCILFAGAQIYDSVQLGRNVVIQANAVAGCHGQSYERGDRGEMIPMPHLGGLHIGDGVRIGANSTIVRGTLRDTIVGADTSIGNNVNIGHNVEIGERCFIGAGAVLGGSASVGNDSWVSMGAVILGVPVGENVTAGVGAIVTRPVDANQTVNGFPARPMKKTT